ncbi:DUF5655 domain-containing protein [Schumannella sp. 10F1B-5-1]|uniref:DUF5655 domain-containing protein n=1 Tax=Schumannella sp. 10F1B-5-1 TaxID=2590780 RepID=UPI0011322E2A|nr:DUF5655 domain-containing protein [Schumannella sp. 10F1B-5-1]TPW78253.1 hypothetical protein FJ658_00125 [Schumannella sp. 10F1B-5-1]
MADGTWADLTRGLDDDDLAKLTAFRDFCRSLGSGGGGSDGGELEERIHTADITFARARSFASAYIKSHYLELGIELRREVHDPKPRTAFATTKAITMHRYSLRELDQFDDRIRDLIREAFETVGPGGR